MFLEVCVLLWVGMHLYVDVCAHLCRNTWRPELMPDVFLNHFPPFLRQSALMNSELTDLHDLTNQLALGIPHVCPKCCDYYTCPVFI